MEEGRRGGGSEGVEERRKAGREDRLWTTRTDGRPNGTSAGQGERAEQDQYNKRSRRVFRGCATGTIQLSYALHAHHGTRFLDNPPNQVNNNKSNRAMVRFSGAREKGVTAFVGCFGVSQEVTMGGVLIILHGASHGENPHAGV